MIKVEVNKEKCNVQIGGTLINLSAEMIMAINGVYESIGEVNSGASEVFKDLMINNIEVAFMDSDELKEAVKPNKKEMIEALKSFLEDLEEED